MLCRCVVVMLLGLATLPNVRPSFAADFRLPAKINYSRDIKPILSDKCYSCHGPDGETRQAGLRLDVRDQAIQPLESGSIAIVPGKVADSELVARIETADEGAVMPPPATHKTLSQHDKQLLRQWIDEGAEYHPHWAFVPPEPPELPVVKKPDWIHNEIDLFVLSRMEAEGLKPSAEADRITLLRRVTFDLTGLPPTPEEVEAFRNDHSDAAYERVVDRLLASPRYGERMAMHWLDLARYADTHGYNNDGERTQWPWRDWVINAFNANMPYDQFVIEQLAGDLLPDATRSQRLATAFNRNHGVTSEGGIIPEEYRVAYVADRVHTTATAFMGLSMQCAHCHDHKFDPISQRDYYRFFAFFNNVSEDVLTFKSGEVIAAAPSLPFASPEQQAQLDDWERRRSELVALQRAREAKTDELPPDWKPSPGDDDAAKLWKIPASERTAEQNIQLRRRYLEKADRDYHKITQEIKSIDKDREKLKKAIPAVMVMDEMHPPRQTFLLRRGEYDQPAEAVAAGVLGCFPPLSDGMPANRLGLAKWLTAPNHPLTARVTVNRWWQSFFGTGIVETVEDFGSQGAWPTHPELLDWLAIKLISSGWNVKAMQKLIVMSATYRQSSNLSAGTLEHDPKNQLLTHGPRIRLPAEAVRDSALAVSGLLVNHVGGPSARPYQPDGLWQDVSVERSAVYKQDQGDGLYRRSIYTFWKRTCPPPALATFDAPDRETCVMRRARTNTPLQALILMNDPTYVEAARVLAERILMEGGETDEARLNYLFRRVVSRDAVSTEQETLVSLVKSAIARFRQSPERANELLHVGQAASKTQCDPAVHAAWTTVASVILSMDNAITRE
jgi:hypothetical protein